MEIKRKKFQGISNIIRFNWHFYIVFLLIFFSLIYSSQYLQSQYKLIAELIAILAFFSVATSLIASYYIYDKSNLYSLDWTNHLNLKADLIINIHSGFDETSAILQSKFPESQLSAFDFYDPKINTEVSIKRARKFYPPNPDTSKIEFHSIPLEDLSVDIIFIIFSAHEIRKLNDKIIFMKEINRVLKTNGKVVITEHLRDIPNFLIYNIGSFHFFGKKHWRKTFNNSNFEIQKELKTTPFITTFILQKNGITT